MRTDDLIGALSEDLRPALPWIVALRVLLAGLLGAGAALALLAQWLGFRADLDLAIGAPFFWVKTGYALLLGLAGFWCVERLSRPAGSGRGGLALAIATAAILASIAILQLVAAPVDARLGMWLGGSWNRCPFYVLVLSAPVMTLILVTMRGLAPTRLVLAGAAAGLFAGGLAAAVYGLHCPESTSAFVATWYSLGVALSALVGSVLGPLVLRWR